MKHVDKRAHWTHRLFVEEPELYLPFLEQAAERAPAEVDALRNLFAELGVPAGGRVLDVACGIGRHAVPLARLGYDVTGIDISPLYVRMAVDAAKAAGVAARFVVGDMGAVRGLMSREVPFDSFINMFTSNGYYGREGDVSLYRQLRRLAAPDAALVVFTAHRDWMVRNLEVQALDKAGGIRIVQNRTLDPETSLLHSEWSFFEGRDESLRLRLKLEMEHRVYALREFREVLEEAGWRYVKAMGSDRSADFRLEELTHDSKTMWVVAQAPGQ